MPVSHAVARVLSALRLWVRFEPNPGGPPRRGRPAGRTNSQNACARPVSLVRKRDAAHPGGQPAPGVHGRRLAASGSDLLVNLIEGIKKINLSSGLDGIYQSVKKIVQAIAKTFKSAKDMLDKLRDEILGLVRKAWRGVEKWI